MANQEENSFKSDPLISSQHTTRSSQSLPSIIENDTSISLSDIQKELNRISPIDSDQISSMHYIDSSSIEDQDFSTSRRASSSDILNSLNRKISVSETDLLASIHRNINKQLLDNQSDDDLLFLEWDKERNLFQDYINSLRKEIRVLLQERLEYQTQDNNLNDDHMKIDLLQKSLEEKNFVFEQLQTEYELTKEKNTNLIRKISHLQTDTKTQIGTIDELNQKLTDLTVDLQNHSLVKRRLETSIKNLENDCKILDAERLRLTNDIKENQHNKQDLDKLLQKANVQIAEQGSTIEMLRSENVQVRSQLSTIQRRMFQEKQQIMDYLRQIENDLIEKEQIKQRELSLRQDHEQLQLINKQDRKEIEQLKNSIHQNQEQIKELQLIIETQNEQVSQLTQLRQEVENLSTQRTQLDEANRAWQRYDQNQLMILHNRFKLVNNDNLSFDETIQQIENRFNNLQNEYNTLNRMNEGDTDDELRQKLAVLTAQCTQLDEANQAWQQYQQTQLENFRNKLQDYLPFDENISFDQVAQLIIDQILEKEADKLNQDRDTQIIDKDSIDDDKLKHDYILLKTQCTELDNANRAWQQFYQNQIDLLKNQLKDYLDFDQNLNFDQIIQIIAVELEQKKQLKENIPLGATMNSNGYSDQPTLHREPDDQILTLQEEIKSLEQQLTTDRSSIDSLKNSLQLISQENEHLKQQNDLLLKDNHNLTNQLNASQLPTDNFQQTLHSPVQEVNLNSIHDITPAQSSYSDQEIHELQTQLTLLTTQCAELNETNHAWQQFHQNQLEIFRTKLQDSIPLDTNSTLEQIAQQILDEKNSLSQTDNQLDSPTTINSLQKQLENYQYNESILAQNLEELNQKLLDVYKQCEEFREHNAQLILSKQQVDQQLQERENQIKELELTIKNLEEQTDSSEESNDDDNTNTTLAVLTARCAQLDEANQAWQQFQQAQIESFRTKFQDYLSLNDIISFDQAAQLIIDLINKEREEANHNNDNIESFLDTIKELNHELYDIKERCNELDHLNKQLLIENENLNSRSIVVGHHSALEPTIIEPQPTIPITYKNHETQTESYNQLVSSISDSEKSSNLDDNTDRLDDYINEMSSFSSIDLTNHLTKECQQILFKQNIKSTSLPDLDLNQLAYITIYSLYDRHLTDEAKQLYNETVIRALKQEYELINDEKNDLIEKLNILQIKVNQLQTDFNENQLLKEYNTEKNEDDFIEIKSTHDVEIQCSLQPTSVDSSVQTESIQVENNDWNDEFSPFEERTLSSIPQENLIKQTADHETQTDDSQQDKLAQINNKLKRALQTIKEKVQRIINEKPELFPDSNDDTIERIEHLISAVRNQTDQIESLQAERDNAQKEINELRTEQHTSEVQSSQDHQKQINQLQQNLSQKDEERSLLREHLDSVELELTKTLDDYASAMNKFETIVQERDALVEQHNLQLTEYQREIEQLQEEIAQLKQISTSEKTDIPSEEDIKSMEETIEQQSQEIKDLTEKYLSQMESQDEFIKQKEVTDEQIKDYQNQIENLTQEHTKLLEDIEKNVSTPVQTTENESQTDDHQYEKLTQVNSKLKRALQTYREKLNRVASERPDLFDGIGEETSERLDHLISTLENQASQAERDRIEKQLQTEIEDYQKQIDQLQQTLSQKDEERNLLREHLNNVELELRKTLDDNISTMSILESIVEERDALVKQQTLHSVESQSEVEELKEQLAEVKRSPDCKHVQTQTIEDIKALDELVEEQSEQLKDLNEKNASLSSQLESQAEQLNREKKELEDQLNEHKHQVENLTQERTKFLEDVEKHVPSSAQTTDNESQTDDRQHEKLVQINNKLKRALQGLKDKIQRAVTENPDLFNGIGDETNERLDHLITTVENQATQINSLQTKHDQAEEQLQSEIKELQNSLELCQNELDSERQVKAEQLVSSAASTLPPLEDYQTKIDQLQQDLSEKEDERISLAERLKEVEIKLSKTVDDHTSSMTRYESLAEEHTLHSTANEREIEQLKTELAELKQSPDHQHVQIQTDEDIKALDEAIEEQSEQLRDLNEKNASLSSQLESQAEKLNQEKKEVEERLNEHKHQIENLIQERTKLLEDIEKNVSSPVETTNNESQTNDHQHEKLTQVNNKLKRALQGLKDKIQRAVTERPDLFDGVSEETSERLDHLISTLQNQATQIDVLQAERDQVEKQLQSQQLVSAVPSSSNDDSSSIIENYENQIEQLQQNLSEKEDERISLAERLNQAELDLKKTVDDYKSTLNNYQEKLQSLTQERNALTEQQAHHSAEHEHEIAQLKEDNNQIREELAELKQSPDCQHVEIQTDEDIHALQEMLKQQTEELNTLMEKCLTLSTQVDSNIEFQALVDRQRNQTEQQIKDYQNEIEGLMQERARLSEELEKNITSPIHTTDNKAQTDDQQHEKVPQSNNKLKRALQVLKDKIHRVVTERPDLFDGISEETSERLDHLISTLENQATQIDASQAERDRIEKQVQTEIENNQKQIYQLQQTLSQKDAERSLLREHLNSVELELRKTLDDHASAMSKLESIEQERDALVKQETLHSAESQREIEELKEELAELKRSPDCKHVQLQTDEDIKSMEEMIEQQSQGIKDLTEKYLSQMESQDEFIKQKKVADEQMKDYQNQIENLTQERTKLLEDIEKNVSSPVQTTENESQTDDHQYEKLTQVNNKLKSALQIYREKLNRVASERPDLFDGIGEETSERLDHLISTLENQATQIDASQAERDRIEKQVQTEIENNQKQIDQLQQTLSQKDEERNLVQEHLNNVELELRTTLDDHASAMTRLESIVEEQDALVKQQVLHSVESQRELEELKEELVELKRSPDCKHIQIQTDEDIKSMEETIEQQSQEIRDLTEKYLSQMESQDEFIKQKKVTDEQMKDYQHQIENLTQEHTKLLEDVEKNVSTPVQTTENESQTDDYQHEKLTQVNNKLKHALQTYKEKLNHVASERPDLFDGIGEETSERLDHLISTLASQATQIDVLHAQHDQTEKQLQTEIKELQRSVEAYQYQIENERPVKVEQLVSASPPPSPSENISSSVIEDYQKQIDQFQQTLSEKEEEQNLLREHLNSVELELRKTLDDHASVMSRLESIVEERDALVKQQTLHSAESQREIEELKEELVELKRSPDFKHIQIQTIEDIKALDGMVEEQSEQLKELNEKNASLSSQAEQLNREKKEMEERLNEHKNQIKNLMEERGKLLEEIEKSTPLPIQTTANEVQTDDDEHEKLLEMNNTLKHTVETIGDKIHQFISATLNLSRDIGEDTIERVDNLISAIDNQATQINVLQTERDQAEEKYRHEINNLQNSLEQLENEYHTKLDEHISSLSRITHEIDTQTIDFPTTENQISQTTESDDNDLNNWFDASPDITEKEDEQFRDVDNQYELVSLPSEQLTTSSLQLTSKEALSSNDNSTQTEINFSSLEEIPKIKNQLQQILHENPTLFPSSTENIFEDLDQIISVIKNLQNKINELQSSFDTYRYDIENEHLIKMEKLKSNKPNDVYTQTLGLSMVEEHRKQIEKLQENELIHQREIERLIEERDQARDLLSQLKEEESSYQLQLQERDEQLAQLHEQLQQHDNFLSHSYPLNDIESQTTLDVESPTGSRIDEYQSQIDDLLHERVSLMEQIKQLTSQPSKTDVEIQTMNDVDLMPSSDQGISRHIFEQEMLAWSKESEQLKRFVKQFQIENKKLKDIILKFERMILDYIHENDRLKQENHQLSLINYSSIQKDNLTTSSDKDICYLTLKWLTYEVAQRTSNDYEQQSLISINDNQIPIDKSRTTRLQNERLKNQLEAYTIQFKHVQHEMNLKIKEMSVLKHETARLQSNEIQYLLEIDQFKADLQDDKIKIQQLEHELLDFKLKQLNNNENSVDNLRELLDLKERELNALKEKLDYTKQTHQIELQEVVKANQFSHDTVKRYEQADLRHQEKRRELETRLGKFCAITKTFIDNQKLFIENPIIDIDELRKLIAETDNAERVTTTLSPIRDCLSLLEAQMKDLHHTIIENHARRSKRWKYTLAFECLSCESRWEVTHDIRDLQEACLDPKRFLESSMVEPMAGCACPIMIDFIESDIRLCIDDMLNEVILRTTVK